MKIAAIIKAMLVWSVIILLWLSLYNGFVLMEIVALLVGLVVGLVLDASWNINKQQYGLDIIEHYHWGLLLQIIAIYLFPWLGIPNPIGFLLFAMGLYLVIVEMVFQEHQFATGSSHELPSDVIGLVLGVIILILTGYMPLI